MNVIRAVTGLFDDQEAISKLAICALLTGMAILLTPTLIGALLWIPLFGYQLALIANIRKGNSHALPRWNDFGSYFGRGGVIAMAAIAYNLGNILLGACIATIWFFGNGTFTGSASSVALVCCALPALVIYNLIVQPTLALGMSRYAEDSRAAGLVEFAELLGIMRARADLMMQWWMYIGLAIVILVVLWLIPVIGWVFASALTIPLPAAITAVYAENVIPKRQR